MQQQPCGRALRLVSIGSWVAERGQDAPPHHHAWWKVTYYRTGRITSTVAGATYSIRPGTALVVPPLVDHAEMALTPYANYYALLDVPVEPDWPEVLTDDRGREVGGLLRGMLREQGAHDGSTDACLRAIITLLDATLSRARNAVRQPPAQGIVARAERLFERHYSETITVDGVAADLGLSSSGLRRAFAGSGRPAPREVLREVRLRHALELLSGSDLSLDSVAARCGYSSASHLSREVKARTGDTPGSLRGAGVAQPVLESPLRDSPR